MSSSSDMNISLEQHLIESLEPLVPILPENLSHELSTVLGSASNAAPTMVSPTSTAATPVSPHGTAYSQPLIPYSLLSAISAWTRSADGREALTERDPPLDPNSYAMVALLAGTRTSPEKRFPDVQPVPTDGADARKELNDRRAVTAVLNALLSIFGAGVATWWAADRLRWRDEWKALLAIGVAIAVASSEAILYIIWDSRRSRPRSKLLNTLQTRGRIAPAEDSVDSLQGSPSSSEKSTTGKAGLSRNTDVLPQASPITQEHRTMGGLRERKKGSARTGHTKQPGP